MIAPVRIEPLNSNDISRAMEFVTSAGWNQTANTWSRFLSFNPTGCFKATVDGRMVGTVTSTCYGQHLAWIGMMLVAPEARRQGVGRSLMVHMIDYLRSRGMQTIKLDATPMGRPLYESLHFEAQYDFYRWRREATTLPVVQSESMSWESLTSELRQLDLRAFGLDRLAWLRQAADEGIFLMQKNGFGMLRPGRLNDYLGPVTAASLVDAQSIIHALCQASNCAMIWDIPKQDPQADQLARSLGFAPLRPLTRMVLGTDNTRPDLDLQWAICDPASG